MTINLVFETFSFKPRFPFAYSKAWTPYKRKANYLVPILNVKDLVAKKGQLFFCEIA